MWGLKLKLWVIGSIGALLTCSMIWIHINNLKGENELLKAQNQSQEIIIENYESNYQAMLEYQAKANKIQKENRLAQDEIIKSKESKIILLKKAMQNANDQCFNTLIPESISNILYQSETTNKNGN